MAHWSRRNTTHRINGGFSPNTTMKRIDSTHNPDIRRIAKLVESRRQRTKEHRFVIEGARELSRAILGDVTLEAIYFCPELFSDEGQSFFATQGQSDPEWIEVSKAAFSKISYRENPDGLLAIAPLFSPSFDDLQFSETALILVLDNLEKPGNVGALLRTADSVGVDAVFVTGKTDLYNPNTIRASQGSLFNQTVIACETIELIPFLKNQRISIVGAQPDARLEYWDSPLEGRVAIVLGTEHDGLSADWIEHTDLCVSIPMHGCADSLNVATSGALLLYEALRQRRWLG